MYCPSCRDEFRDGFTRCERCDADLVAVLGAEPRREAPPEPTHVRLLDYCGFLSLDEARASRDRLRAQGLRADILIREAPGSDLSRPPDEEYWLRVDQAGYVAASGILGFDPAEAEDAAIDESFDCSACGARVAAEESFCPKCGARFDED